MTAQEFAENLILALEVAAQEGHEDQQDEPFDYPDSWGPQREKYLTDNDGVWVRYKGQEFIITVQEGRR